MGDIADMMLDGTLCESCGVYLGKATEFPRLCSSCAKDRRDMGREVEKIGPNYIDCGESPVCPECGKRLKTYEGMQQHRKEVHEISI